MTFNKTSFDALDDKFIINEFESINEIMSSSSLNEEYAEIEDLVQTINV